MAAGWKGREIGLEQTVSRAGVFLRGRFDVDARKTGGVRGGKTTDWYRDAVGVY